MPNNADISPQPDPPEQDRAGARPEPSAVNTEDGDSAEGSLDQRQSTFVEGDQYNLGGDFRGAQVNIASTVITEAHAYNVAGLPNPYLGLRAFTAAERDIFAGRERIVRALVERLSTDDGDRLLFIVGASGSGKSSLARAGLLPALAEHLGARSHDVHPRIIDHPGRTPTTALARALDGFQTPSAAPAPRLLLLLVDQFEEIFSQAAPDERDRALTLLADLAVQPDLPVRIIATLRSDFLPQLVADPRFEVAERRKVVLRAMRVEELAEAIQRPIQVRHPDKRIEPALLERLASDAAADAAYLPLLQVTLEDLWRGGQLRLGAYRGLADAIQRRANAVYAYRDYDGLQQAPRTLGEQQTILDLFLTLVRVSLDEEQHNVRWRRPRAELTQGDPQREHLIADLATARLLRTDREIVEEDGREREIETVDIVHEALLSGWPTLKDGIDAEQETLRRRVRFDLALGEWRANKRGDDYLLTGVHLAEAEALKQCGDSVFQREGTQEFYARSVNRQAAEQEEQLRLERRSRRLFQILATLLAILLFAAIVVLLRPVVLEFMARRAVTPVAINNLPVAVEPVEVTNARYKLCVEAGPCLAPIEKIGGIPYSTYYLTDTVHGDLPITGIDAYQATAFCSWIGRRLPTFTEWHFAALEHAGRGTDAEWRTMRERANFDTGTSSAIQPLPVKASGSATPEGIYDLLGNVAEWTLSTPSSQEWDGGADVPYEFLLTVGGSFAGVGENTIENPLGFRPSDRRPDIGFRCVAD
jgi:Novel STAND NTPase 1/Sulfatase-modifying factor enzyme 1